MIEIPVGRFPPVPGTIVTFTVVDSGAVAPTAMYDEVQVRLYDVPVGVATQVAVQVVPSADGRRVMSAVSSTVHVCVVPTGGTDPAGVYAIWKFEVPPAGVLISILLLNGGRLSCVMVMPVGE